MNYRTTSVWMLLFGGLLAAGCHPRDGRKPVAMRELMHTSFEELPGWSLEVSPTLATEKAHTGKYSIRVDSAHEYSATYHSELGQLCTHRPRRFTLGAWVWVPSAQDDAVLVFSITNPGQPDAALHKTVYLTDSGPYQEWKYVSRDFDLPSNISSKSQLAIYLWKSNARTPVYADDLRLTELW